MIVPEVEKTINTAPQYADLRRVYTARVAADWIRLQDAKTPTDYRKIINSNDSSPSATSPRPGSPSSTVTFPARARARPRPRPR
ncbi:hypothetical protein ACFYXH_22350 [Streptomyces sp. NPDC002730]|uniref:hypothetical protein n=1 Tax=Streptomyces sp. NPDC002730 TaxID=3364662 RepID=UPI0036852A84